MALNFPDSPTIGQVYNDSTSGFSYEWDGTVWQSFSSSSLGQIKIFDDISGSFNGTLDTFALTVSGTALVPANAQQLLIVLGGVVQEPATDYNVSFSNIVFTTPPTGGLSFSGVSLGPAVDVSVPGDGTVTPVKLSTGGPSWNTSGDVLVSGITTISNASGTVTIGIGTTALLVEGNARVTGILSVGQGTVTIDGTNNQIVVGTGVTIYGNTGIISATTINATNFVGNGSGLTGAGSTVADDTTTNSTFYPLFTSTTSGTVTASKVSTTKLSFNPSTGTLNATNFVGNGSGLTGAGSTVADDTTTNSTFYPLFTSTTSGTVTASKVSTTKLSFNPSTGTLSATAFNGPLGGNSTTATALQTARSINGVSFNGSADITVNPTSGAFSNGQGAKTIQSGGSASGGSSGDIYYIY